MFLIISILALLWSLLNPSSCLVHEYEEGEADVSIHSECDYRMEYLLVENHLGGRVEISRQRMKSPLRYVIRGGYEGGDRSQQWSFIDWVVLTDCMGDGSPELADFTISDEDHNGIFEFYITYVLRPDVTDCCYPEPLKTLVYENGIKYAVRGQTWLLDDVWSAVQEEASQSVDRGGQMLLKGENSLLNASKPIQDKAIALFKSFQ